MIVVPMAGRGGRFREAGYTTPEFMLTWRKKSLFFHTLDSFRAHFATERFLIVLPDMEDALSFVEREIPPLGIPRNRVSVVALKNATNGPAETVAVGLRQAQVPPNVPLTILNADTFRRDFSHPRDFDPSVVDGYLEVFSGDGGDRPFVRPSPDRPDERRVAEVSESGCVSDLRCAGLHHFRSCEFYLSLYEETESRHPDEFRGGGYRVALLHDRATRRGSDIRYARISSDDVRFFGTPAEYERRLGETPGDGPLAFCIGGQIRSDRRHLEAIADLARRHEADVYISTWRMRGHKTLVGAVAMQKKIRLFGRPAAYLLPYRKDLGKIFPETERLLAALSSEDCSEELRDVFPDAVIDVEEDDALDLALDTKEQDKNSLRMLYKIWRCNRLKRAGEAMRDRKYESVVRFRPDILPSPDVFTAAEMRPGTVALPAFDPVSPGLPDLFWACDSETDDRLSNLFGKAASAPDRNWKEIHPELKRWTEQLSLTLKQDRTKVDIRDGFGPRDQAFARSLVCDALRNGRYSSSADLTRNDAKTLAALVECSDRPSSAGLTIDRLRSMYSAKHALVVVRGILLSALSISEPPHEDPALHHCADLVLLTLVAELGWKQIERGSSIVRRLKNFLAYDDFFQPESETTSIVGASRDFLASKLLTRRQRRLPLKRALRRDFLASLAPFRTANPDNGPLLRNAPNAGFTSSLDELVWTVHRDLLTRLGEKRFLMIARSIRGDA